MNTTTKNIFLFFSACFLASSIHGQEFYNVIKYGAKNDSSKIATKAIAAAIDAASKKGGGTIFFPAGKYLTGPIHRYNRGRRNSPGRYNSIRVALW